MVPRQYQSEAVQSIWDYFTKGGRGNPIVAMPTGTGKALVLNLFIRSVFHYFGASQKIIVATHRKKLVEQNAATLRRIWPDGRIGINSAKIGRRDTRQPVIFVAIDSVMNDADSFGKVDLLIIDECHLVDDKPDSRYARFIGGLRAKNPLLKVIGLTATPWRAGLGMLDEGETFSDICYNLCTMAQYNRLTDEGFLAPLVPLKTTAHLDATGVHMQQGDYKLNELAAAVDQDHLTKACIEEAVRAGNDPDNYRYSWMAFGVSIKHCENILKELLLRGVAATIVHSKMDEKVAERNLEDFLAGKYRCIVSQGILTTGFDHPPIDMIIMMRNTKSSVLWVQMLGRGTRIYDGSKPAFPNPKTNTLVLDFAHNTAELGPINDPKIPKKRGKSGPESPPVKICPVATCMAYNHASARVCCNCGHEFKFELKLSADASSKELIKRPKPPKEDVFPVTAISYSEHIKKSNKSRSLKVSYTCGSRFFSEWICPEHEGPAYYKANDWWKARSNGKSIPATVADCLTLSGELRVPTHIKVITNTERPIVTKADFTGTAFGTQFNMQAPPRPVLQGNIAIALAQRNIPAAHAAFADD